MDIDAYFARIGYEGSREPTLATLRGIHAAHPLAIPFENIEPLLKRPVPLDPEALADKLVTRGRGGYCFEQNTLLQHVLTALGFDVSAHLGRVMWMMPPGRMSPRTHMVLKVETEDGPYLADVGFGGVIATAPLRLQTDIEQQTPHEMFRLIAVGDEYQLQAKLPSGWSPTYQFSLAPQLPMDMEVANWFTATHPAMPFINMLMMARAGEDRMRHALRNTDYTRQRVGGEPEQRTLASAGELHGVLNDIFRLPVSAEDAAAVFAKVSPR